VHQSREFGEFVDFSTLNLGFGFSIRDDSRAWRAIASEAQQRLMTPLFLARSEQRQSVAC